MNWHRHPELLDRLAAEYALGTLAGGARRRFETVMRRETAVARAVARWSERLQPMDAKLPPLPAGDALWNRIEAKAFPAAPAPAPAPAARPAAQPTRRPAAKPAAPSWWQRWLAPIPAGALAFGLVAGTLLPTVWQALQADRAATQLPEAYVGVLATQDGRQGLVVSSLRRGLKVDLKRITAVPVPAGATMFLWTVDAAGVIAPVGPLPAADFVTVALPRAAEEVFSKAVELAVSLEPTGTAPAQPSTAFVYRGLCGKVWPAPPAR